MSTPMVPPISSPSSAGTSANPSSGLFPAAGRNLPTESGTSRSAEAEKAHRVLIEGPTRGPEPSGAVLGCREAHAHPERLSVTSVNIRFDPTPYGGSDGFNDWGYRKDYLAEVVNRDRPDILGTQEGLQSQLREFGDALGDGYATADAHRDWRDVFYPTLFFNPSTVDVQRSGDAWLSNTPDVPESKLPGAKFPRLMTWAEISHGGKNLFVVNTHLANLNPAMRTRQARILTEQIKRFNTQNLPLVVMGDFNEAAGGRTMDIMKSELPDLVDPWEELGLQEKSSYNGFNKSKYKPGRIDWIMQSGSLSHPMIKIRDDYRLHPETDKVQYPSDHNPVNLTVDGTHHDADCAAI